MSQSNSQTAPIKPADPVFVRLGLEDLPVLVALERQCFASPWNEKQFRLGLEGGVFKVFGLKDGAELAAYCSFYHVADSMEILNIAVRPERRRGGLGTRLLGLVLDICRRLGVASASLEVRESNTAARALYGNFGFTPCGLRKGYYPDNGEDAVVMRLDLDKPGVP